MRNDPAEILLANLTLGLGKKRKSFVVSVARDHIAQNKRVIIPVQGQSLWIRRL